MKRPAAVYSIHVCAGPGDNIKQLRFALKALRRLGLRCVNIVEIPPPPNGARRRPEIRSARQGETIMDMRKFSGERFIKLVDVAEGPIPERIADVREGKY